MSGKWLKNVTWKMTVTNENFITDYVDFRDDTVGPDNWFSLVAGTRQGFQVKK